MRRDNAAGGNWTGVLRRRLAAVGGHVIWQARRDGTARVRRGMGVATRVGRCIEIGGGEMVC
jgi:hypothetical protein